MGEFWSKMKYVFRNKDSIDKIAGKSMKVNLKSDLSELCAYEKIEAQVCGIKMAVKNIEDGIEMLRKADESLCVAQGILHKMNELSVQSASGTYSKEQREEANMVYKAYKDEINQIGIKSSYNGIPIFDPSKNPNIDNIDYTLKLQIGAGPKETIMIKIEPMNISVLGLADCMLSTQTGAAESISCVLNAIDMISNRRVLIGTTQNTLMELIKEQNAMIKDLTEKKKKNSVKDVSGHETIRYAGRNIKNENNVIPLIQDKEAN
ncbi:hypothetical protein [uncultured Clostridium sp.]|uniref:flagellin N-terminal helical domain-containing protein n=1 Tax=uncultured Clostridium sp. TaxID=59620 RepID=UPI0025F96B54|nr:hypothetical protein [uncultured Clostridium sp.]